MSPHEKRLAALSRRAVRADGCGMTRESDEILFESYADVHEALTSPALTRSIDYDLYEHGNLMENVLLMLSGEAHRGRRRVENQVFRRQRLERYESESFPAIVDNALESLVASQGEDLIELGLRMAVVLSAESAGVDLDRNSVAQREELSQLLRVLARGEAIDAEKGDIEAIKLQVRDALDRFERQFFARSRERRAEILRADEQGGFGESLPHDVLSLLLSAQSALDIDDGTVLRETAFFVEAGAHTSAQTFTNTLHYVFEWSAGDTERRTRLESDLETVQRCVHEALRLRPTNPRMRRRAVSRAEIGSKVVEEGAYVALDSASANRDPSIYGPDAEVFDPDRRVPSGIKTYGHSFGGGIHSCIGRVLAAGLPAAGEEGQSLGHLFGLVPVMVQKALQRGVQPDPNRPPEADKGTRRWTRWISYPVVFESG